MTEATLNTKTPSGGNGGKGRREKPGKGRRLEERPKRNEGKDREGEVTQVKIGVGEEERRERNNQRGGLLQKRKGEGEKQWQKGDATKRKGTSS